MKEFMKRNGSFGRLGGALVALIVLTLVLAPDAWAQSKYKTLHKFAGGTDGRLPKGGLVLDSTGNLYGTTTSGGTHTWGTVFKLAPNSDGSWTESVLHNFADRPDGEVPIAGLIFDQAGNLYGTTCEGGAGGQGAVFELSPNLDGSWTESVLYSFCSLSNCVDGEVPIAGLIFDQAGNLYGTTWQGGAGGQGAVFELSPNLDGSWTESVLHSFMGSDGADPAASLIFDLAGNLYGTTYLGGVSGKRYVGQTLGVVFRLTPQQNGTWKESVLHRFVGTDGANPHGGLAFDQAGNLYGTTSNAGSCKVDNSGCGTVFQLTPNADGSWKEKVLHHFRVTANGAFPWAGLIFDQTGNLYGTTYGGGNPTHCPRDFFGCGVVFKLAPDSKGGWSESVVHRFVDDPGAEPFGGLIFDTAGNLYGTTRVGFSTFGSVFEITP